MTDIILDKKTGKYVNRETGEEVDIVSTEKLGVNEEKDKKVFKHILG